MALITGLGTHSPFGHGVAAFWEGACSGRTAVAPALIGHAARIAGGPDLVAAAHEAVTDAGLGAGELGAAALVLATTTGGMARWLADQPGREFGYHGPAAGLARALGIGGPIVVPQAACASGTAALQVALDLLRTGRAEVVLVGGADGWSDFVARGFAALGALDERGPARPFDRDRAGMSLGEGAAFLLLEHPDRRPDRVLARLAGAGLSGDGLHLTAPDPEGRGLARAIAAALADAHVPGRAVDFVSAHGTGTRMNDAMEARALAAAGLSHAPVHGLKGSLGHTLGAAGVFEALLCVRVLASGRIPPTTGLRERDPEIELDVVTAARAAPVRVAVSTSAGFGGANAAAVLCRP
jgi:3-oxoacyl-(acyl-carrier-protein) synthase